MHRDGHEHTRGHVLYMQFVPQHQLLSCCFGKSGGLFCSEGEALFVPPSYSRWRWSGIVIRSTAERRVSCHRPHVC